MRLDGLTDEDNARAETEEPADNVRLRPTNDPEGEIQYRRLPQHGRIPE